MQIGAGLCTNNSKSKSNNLLWGFLFSLNCAVDKELTLWIILHCNSESVIVFFMAGRSLLHSPTSRSRDHISCRQHPVCFPCCFTPALTFILLSSQSRSSASSISCILRQFWAPSTIFLNLIVCPAAGWPNRVT